MNIQPGEKGINWTDATWNPITGCLHGCPYCYARDIAHRFGRSFKPAFNFGRLKAPLKRKKPTKIFVNSVSDTFGHWIPDNWVKAILRIVRQCPQHTFQFLTKAPWNIAKFNPWPDNCWLGGTVDELKRLEPTLEALRQVDAKVRFISFEPLNESVGIPNLSDIEWLIIGAQTGKNGHQPPAGAVSGLLSAANECKLPVLMKDNLIWPNRRVEFPIMTPAPVQSQMF